MQEEEVPFTIEGFYQFIKEGRLMGAKCLKCGALLLPPRPMCTSCFSRDLEWKELKKQGKLLTYTVIHVSPERFQSLTPYAVGIVKFEEGAQLPGIIADAEMKEIKVGMNLSIDFKGELASKEWPHWPRYRFKSAPS